MSAIITGGSGGDTIQPEIDANWARAQAKEVMSDKARTQLNDILSNIKKAAADNKMSSYASSVDDIVKKELQRRGFLVEFNSSFSNDPRENSYYTITWYK